jgi:putative resolvase
MSEDQLLKVTAVAEYFDVTRPTVREWIKDGKIKAIRLAGGHYRIRLSEVKRFAQEKYGAES